MTQVEQLAQGIVEQLAHSVNLTIPHRDLLARMIVHRFAELVPSQVALPFSEADARVNAEQAAAILALLKKRRSQGVTNVELAAIALQYNARIFELRRAPHNYKITCERNGRMSIYRLVPEDY